MTGYSFLHIGMMTAFTEDDSGFLEVCKALVSLWIWDEYLGNFFTLGEKHKPIKDEYSFAFLFCLVEVS